MIDFVSEGLLEGLTDEARAARLRLLNQLAADDVPPDELKRAVAENRLALLPVERALSGELRYTGRQISEMTGVPLDHLERALQAAGIARTNPDEVALGEHDLEATRILARFRAAGLPEEEMLEVTRVLGRGLAHGAEAIRTLVGRTLIHAGITEHDLALANVNIVKELLPLQTLILGYLLRLHLRDQIRGEAVTQAQLAAGRLPGTREITACFADLVGFTSLGETLDANELGSLAGRLAELATDAARPPVRLVKMIGDAAMLVAPESEPLVDAALDLVCAAEQAGPDFPELRIGMARGAALNRSGDWYGQPINLASRVTSVASAGSILATEQVRQSITNDRYNWSALGSFRLKGIEAPAPLFRVARETTTA